MTTDSNVRSATDSENCAKTAIKCPTGASVTKVMAFDSGAERMGLAVIEGDGKMQALEHGSGVLGLPRVDNGKKTPYQEYRLRLIEMWIKEADFLFKAHRPDVVVSEIIPVVGGGKFVLATQSQLAATAITTVQAVAYQHKIPVKQLGATTVKAKIGNSKKATKVQVRNGVFDLLPSTKRYKPEWTKIFDCSDAFAIGLCFLGYRKE